MKQKLTLISLIMIILETICLFTPFCFQKEFWQYDQDAITYHGRSSLEFHADVNIFGVSTKAGTILAVIVIAFMLLSFLSFLIASLRKENGIAKIGYFTPLFSFAALILLAAYACLYAVIDTEYWRYEWSIGWLFYIIVAFHLVTIVFAFLLSFKRFDEPTIQAAPAYQPVPTPAASPADEILRYKELLDKGVITQEEFDAKKKQLLGL